MAASACAQLSHAGRVASIPKVAVPLEMLIFDPSACAFPRPRVPALAEGFNWISDAVKGGDETRPGGAFRDFSRGRYALYEAFRLAGLNAQTTLLAPTYHCPTMLAPALALGGDIQLYPLRSDLSVDQAALDSVIQRARKPVRALLASHLFAFAQPLAGIAEWCAARGIALIEDGSHVLFTERHCPPGIGQYGDFVTSSPYKFFSSPDGGLLFARGRSEAEIGATIRPPWRSEIRALKQMLAAVQARAHSRASCRAERLGEEFGSILERAMIRGKDLRRSEGVSAYYDSDSQNLGALRLSRAVQRRSDIGKIAAQRRRNYERWIAGLAGAPNCRPLFADLPDGCIPYMLPLYIERPDSDFYYLKHLGVPIWRWDSIAVSNCATANDYRCHLLHLPCHQALNDVELDWMIAAVRLVMHSKAEISR